MTDKEKIVNVLVENIETMNDDIKILFTLLDDADIEDNLRELAAGSLIYFLSPGDIIPDTFGNILSMFDDILISKIVTLEILENSKEKGDFYKSTYADQYNKMNSEIGLIKDYLGEEIFNYFKGRLRKLPQISFKGKKAKIFLRDMEAATWLYDEVNEALLDKDFATDEIRRDAQKVDKLIPILKNKVEIEKYNK